MNNSIKRFYTFKNRECPSNELVGSELLADGTILFRMKFHKMSGPSKVIVMIVDFRVKKDGLEVTKANRSKGDGYEWLEQNWAQVNNTSGLLDKLSKIWNTHYGDEWPLNVDQSQYANYDIADLLYCWQVLVANPALTLMVNELGWLNKLKDMNTMSKYKDRARNGRGTFDTNAHRATHIAIDDSDLSDITASNVRSLMGWSKGQYKAIKTLRLNTDQAKSFITVNNAGYTLPWLSKMVERFGLEFLRYDTDTYGMDPLWIKWKQLSSVEQARRTRAGLEPSNRLSRSREWNDALKEFLLMLQEAEDSDLLTGKMLKDFVNHTVPARLLTVKPGELYEYIHMLKDWLRMSTAMERTIALNKIPRGTEYLNVTKRIRTNPSDYRATPIFQEKVFVTLKMKVWHDNLVADCRVVLDAEKLRFFNEKVALKKPKYEHKIGDWLFILPESPQDLSREGEEQSHCVGGYSERIAKGECMIVFMRNVHKPFDPVVTISMKGNVVDEAKGYSNRSVTATEKSIINQWIKKVQKL